VPGILRTRLRFRPGVAAATRHADRGRRSLALDAADALTVGTDSGGLASLLKLSFSELLHDIMNFATVALGAEKLLGMPREPKAAAGVGAR
jgi:hypothetical protein